MTGSRIPARIPADWPNRAASRSLPIGALDWHVQVAGRGPTLLLLHGTGASAHSWADLLPVLAATATVVAPDLPGQGYTLGATPETLALPRIAAELDALLAALRLPPVTLAVGHSAGAALAIQWALVAREPPRAILGFNPSLVPPPALYEALLAPVVTPVATAPAVTGWLAALAARSWLVGGLLDSTRSRIPAAQRRRYQRLFADPAHVHGTMGFMAATKLGDLLRAAKREGFRIPTTFVVGTADHWVPERPLRRVLADAFPAAEVQAWPGGHLLHEEAPERAARLVGELLARAAA